MAFWFLHPITSFFTVSMETDKNGKFSVYEKKCEPIWFRFSGGPTAQSHSFMTKMNLKVRICKFLWQSFWILKFQFHTVALWLMQIVCAKFYSNRLRNGREISMQKRDYSPKKGLCSKCPRLPGSVLKMCVLCVLLYNFFKEPFAHYLLICWSRPKTDFLSSCWTMTTAPMQNPVTLGPFS